MTYKKTNRRDDDKRRGAEGGRDSAKGKSNRGAESRERGAGSREHGAGSRERGASSGGRGAGNRDASKSFDKPKRRERGDPSWKELNARDSKSSDRKPYSDRKERSDFKDTRGERSSDRKPYSDRKERSDFKDTRGERSSDRKPYSDRKERSDFKDTRGERSSDRKSYSDKPARRTSSSRTPVAKAGPFDKFDIDKMREAKAESMEKKERRRPNTRRDAERGRGSAERGRGSAERGRGSANSNEFRGAERAEGREQRAGSREQRAEREPRAESKETREPRETRETREPREAKVTEAKGFERRRTEPDEEIRLNRFIANSGVCSRRKADELIEKGEVTVNGEVIRELGFKVKYSDKIKFEGKLLKPGKLVYVLLNKPKDFITTTDDPMERRTVLDLTAKITNERIFPVGRLDRNTTGLLLLTNDGDLADKLSHPRNQVRKVYEVELDKSLQAKDFEKVRDGLELEDGFAKVDQISYLDGKSKKFVGVEIHIGRNRIVRRIFESLGYEVVRLDRVIYAGLTKKDLSRGRCRLLTKEELIYLKHLNKY